MLTQSELKELLNYNPQTGIFTRKTHLNKHCKINDIAGHKTKHGYVTINIKSKIYYAHRLAWLYVHGEMPKNVIDHINRIKHDNSAKNLRWVTASENINYGVKMNAFKANKPLKIYELNKDGTKGKYIKDFATQKKCASELKMSPVTLLAILRNQRPQRDYFIEKINKE